MDKPVALRDLLHEELVRFDLEAADRDDCIKKLAQIAIDAGFATEGYAEDVIERENDYPTGLPTEIMKVAVPHAMVQDHVLSPAIVVAKLTSPVNFKEMGDGENDVPVEMVFMLVAKGDAEHLAVLQQIICVFAEPELMSQLAAVSNEQELLTLLPELAAKALI